MGDRGAGRRRARPSKARKRGETMARDGWRVGMLGLGTLACGLLWAARVPAQAPAEGDRMPPPPAYGGGVPASTVLEFTPAPPTSDGTVSPQAHAPRPPIVASPQQRAPNAGPPSPQYVSSSCAQAMAPAPYSSCVEGLTLKQLIRMCPAEL